MAAAATVSIFVLLVMVLVLAGFITGLILWFTGGRSRTGEMSCGGCGYNVHGLEQLHCPECGADLRAVGISKGNSGGKRTVGVVLTVLCGFVLVSCVGLAAFSYLAAYRSVVAPAPLSPTQSPQSSASSTTRNASPSQAEPGAGHGDAGEAESE